MWCSCHRSLTIIERFRGDAVVGVCGFCGKEGALTNCRCDLRKCNSCGRPAVNHAEVRTVSNGPYKWSPVPTWATGIESIECQGFRSSEPEPPPLNWVHKEIPGRDRDEDMEVTSHELEFVEYQPGEIDRKSLAAGE